MDFQCLALDLRYSCPFFFSVWKSSFAIGENSFAILQQAIVWGQQLYLRYKGTRNFAKKAICPAVGQIAFSQDASSIGSLVIGTATEISALDCRLASRINFLRRINKRNRLYRWITMQALCPTNIREENTMPYKAGFTSSRNKIPVKQAE